MTSALYLLGLLISVAGLVTLDRRFKLAFFFDARTTLKVLLVSELVFIVWDALGIALGIFYSGASPFLLPLRLAPEFPIEELVFLFLLGYVTLLLYRAFERVRHV